MRDDETNMVLVFRRNLGTMCLTEFCDRKIPKARYLSYCEVRVAKALSGA